MFKSELVLVSLFTLFSACLAYPTGAPLVACEQMRPYHPPTTTSGKAPYVITLSRKAYKPGIQITGTISSPDKTVFRGFLLQARIADNSDTTPLGEFTATDTNTHTNCGNGNKQGLTHIINSNKTSISFTWTAPPNPVGDIHFKLTVVESYNVSRFWLGIYSDVTQDCSIHTSSECDDITTEEPTTGTPYTGTTVTTVTTVTTQSSTMTTAAPSSKIPYDTKCGISKGCFPKCPNGCDFLVTWEQPSTNQEFSAVHFSLQMMVPQTSNVWIAIGLSPAGKMDETNVMACISDGSGVTIESSHNEQYQNVLYSQKTVGLSNMEGSVDNGKISCSFTRQVSSNMTDFINLKEKLYLLVGTGPFQDGMKQQHVNIPFRSANKVDFSSDDETGEDTSAPVLIKLHGSLMVLAWVLCSSVGLVVARHFKELMESKLVCGVKHWFVIHRSMMLLAVSFVVTAFVVIFYEIGGFSNISDPSKPYTEVHPYLGITVTVLTLTNPIMALFRPAPDHRSRPLFNWAHFSVGTIAHIIAVVTIFFGLNLSKAKVDKYATYVMYVYSGIYVLVHFILEVHKRCDDSCYKSLSAQEKIKPYSVEELSSFKSERSSLLNPTEARSTTFTNLVLFIHAVLMISVAVLLVLMICVPEHFSTQ